MLVLSRKQGEEVVIGNDIRLTVLAIRGNQVRLGFTAPPDVSIQRAELGEKAEDYRTLAVGPAASEAEP
jgi:carbon storage regulator